MILSDLLNFSFLFVLLTLAAVKFRLSHNIFILLAGHLVLVFCLNYFLFSPSYFGDQFVYLDLVKYIRSGLFKFMQPYDTFKMHISGILMSLPPVPIANSIYALSMMNVFVFISTYFLLFSVGVLKQFNKMFYLFYPSFALYSAVALRDMWVAFFMIWGVYFVFKKKFLFSVVVMLPLIFIKIQNVLMFIIAIVIYLVFFKSKGYLSKILIFFVFFVFFVFFNSFFTIEKINFYRRAMYIENTRTSSGAELTMDQYVPINNVVDLARMGVTNAFYFVFKPFIWESRKPLQLVQSIENIVIGFIFLKLFLLKRKYKVKSEFLSFLVIYIFIAFSIYGLVVFNFGTAVRYKFPFIVVFVVFYYYELVRKQPLIIKEKVFSIGKGKK